MMVVLSAMIVLEVLAVIALGFFNFLVGIPLGYAFGLSTPTIYVASLVGCVGGTVGLVFIGERLLPPLRRGWNAILRRLMPGRTATPGEAEDEAPPSRRAALMRALSDRHGGVALGLAGPWIIGGPPTALLGVALRLKRRELALGLVITLSVMVTGYMALVHAALR
jgi:hypothetical protein